MRNVGGRVTPEALRSAARGALLCCLGDSLDAREAFVPSRGDPRHVLLGLSEPFVAYGEACFAAAAVRVYEIGTLEDDEVLGDALSCYWQLGSERACGRSAALEQQVEQPKAHRIAQRRP